MNFISQSFIALSMLFTATLPAEAAVKTDLQPIQAAVCAVSEDNFYASVKNLNATIYVASDSARQIILEKINAARAASGLWSLEADKVAVGVFVDKGQQYAGIVMFKDDCVVPGTVKVFPLSQWIGFLTELGLSKEDFTHESGV